jgi:hypothetical protein
MPAADRWGWIRFQVMVGLDYLSSHNQVRNHRCFLNQWNLFHPHRWQVNLSAQGRVLYVLTKLFPKVPQT